MGLYTISESVSTDGSNDNKFEPPYLFKKNFIWISKFDFENWRRIPDIYAR